MPFHHAPAMRRMPHRGNVLFFFIRSNTPPPNKTATDIVIHNGTGILRQIHVFSTGVSNQLLEPRASV